MCWLSWLTVGDHGLYFHPGLGKISASQSDESRSSAFQLGSYVVLSRFLGAHEFMHLDTDGALPAGVRLAPEVEEAKGFE